MTRSAQIPGMIAPAEQDLLRDVALSLNLRTDEVVCEFGAFMGRSAHCLADGLLASGVRLEGLMLLDLVIIRKAFQASRLR